MENLLANKKRISPTDIGVLMILLGALFAGLRPLFGRWLFDDNLTAVVIALYTYIASTLLFLPGGLREVWSRRSHQATAWLAIGCGLFVGLGGLAYFEALNRLPVTTVTMIYFTYPAMVVVAVALLRRRWPQRSSLLATAFVLIGCSLIIGSETQRMDSRIIDYAIAFVSPISWALLLLMLTKPLMVLSSHSRIGFISLGALLAMILVLFWWQPTSFTPQTSTGWLSVLGLVFLSGVLTHLLYTEGVPLAGAERASIVGVFELATALVIGWIIFLEPITFLQVVGVVLICAAMILTRQIAAE